ncbi:MerR family transcriptional regulator [Saccharibacillus sp. O23]|uniref:MerR family transcriptional regulator n=1 Tax=Saccharibacillus sp. O23 TaxID=2009338 RepID=UPI000B4E16FD|nr:MerR family transcriptional regulator [Saccharibacillus sp. O23]OWR28978.1 MerR family transcriptional regulator [Saccharibacillus sp. O23]
MHTVKEAARLTGLTEHAVRFYTDKGLIPSVRRDEHNIRLFDDESIDWLYGVRCLKQSGMSIETMKTYVDLCLEGDSTVFRRAAIMQELKEHAIAELEEAKRRIAHLEEKTALYQAVLEQRSVDTTNPGSWERLRKFHGDVFYAPAPASEKTPASEREKIKS